MRRGILLFCFVAMFLLTTNQVFADSEGPAEAYVKGSETPPYPAYQRGRIYARCIPEDSFSGKGKTFVYEVAKEGDKLLYSYDWYDEVLLFDNHYSNTPFVAMVRLGPWPRGHNPDENQLAIAFYKDGKELSRYSTLDIVRLCNKNPDSVPKSVSHYRVIESIGGFKEIGYGQYAFDIKTYDGKTFSFDIRTGKVVTKAEIDKSGNRGGNRGTHTVTQINHAPISHP